MADKTIMLAFAAGMSTSMLVKRMQDAAKAEGKDYEIFAKSTSDIDAELASDHKPDVLLLGPQVGYLKNDVKKKTDEAGIPMDVINMMDYGMMKGDKVLAAAEAMM
ncbi:PTS sugar transporter subunit IIB [Weissella confusa]